MEFSRITRQIVESLHLAMFDEFRSSRPLGEKKLNNICRSDISLFKI